MGLGCFMMQAKRAPDPSSSGSRFKDHGIHRRGELASVKICLQFLFNINSFFFVNNIL